MSSWDARIKAQKQFEQEHPQPKYDAPEMDAPQVVRHSGGRLWYEVAATDHANSTSNVEMHVTFREKAESATLRLDQLRLMRDEIDAAIRVCEMVNARKQAYNEALTKWTEEREKVGEKAEKEWKSSQTSQGEKKSRR